MAEELVVNVISSQLPGTLHQVKSNRVNLTAVSC